MVSHPLQKLVICKYTQQICQVSTGRIRGQTSLQARPQMFPIDQAIVYPTWMEILLRDLFCLTIAIPSFSLSEEVAGSYRTKHLSCEAFIILLLYYYYYYYYYYNSTYIAHSWVSYQQYVNTYHLQHLYLHFYLS